MAQPSFRALATVTLFAALTLVGLDLGLQHYVPVVHRREVQDGIEDLERSDPQILVLGSSHARTFHVLGQELATRTQGRQALVAVPLENGRIVPYAWLLDHRIRPLVDEQDEHGKKRKSLRRFIILTEWWDTCRGPDDLDWNLPSRAWTLGDYLDDVVHVGSNTFNRNYPQSRWRRLFWSSSLVKDRGVGQLLSKVSTLIRGRSISLSPEDERRTYEAWRRNIEKGIGCIGNPGEMAAFEHLLDFAIERRLDATVVLFPRKPGTLTPLAKQTTLQVFHDKIAAITAPRGVRLVDLTSSTPLVDDDFMEDFDHINAAGNQKFARWALDGPLSFLQTDPPAVVGEVRR